MIDVTEFPYLSADGVTCTSPFTPNYNCIAWAASDQSRWWEPDPWFLKYWPPTAPRQYTLQAYQSAFHSLGYYVCCDGLHHVGVEKIAIYMKLGQPSHAARQLQSGKWTSKLGNFVDVRHDTPHGVEGPGYGSVALYMCRPMRAVIAPPACPT